MSTPKMSAPKTSTLKISTPKTSTVSKCQLPKCLLCQIVYSQNVYPFHEHLHAHKAILYVSQSFFIVYRFYSQISYTNYQFCIKNVK